MGVQFFGYSLPQLQHPQARAEVWKFYRELLGPYWDPERQHVDAKYTSIPLPPFASSEDKVERCVCVCQWAVVPVLSHPWGVLEIEDAHPLIHSLGVGPPLW